MAERYKQEQLFSSEDIVKTEYERMRGFLTRELKGRKLGEEHDFFTALDCMTIVAESLARTMALSRGDVATDLEEFESELITGRINAKSAEGAFLFSVDNEFKDKEYIDEEIVNILLERANDLAKALINEQITQNNVKDLIEAA